MDRKEQLYKAIKRIGWGYVMLYFDINLGTIDILPAFYGFWFFYEAIRDGISQEEESANLLKPIAVLLGIYHAITWLLHIFMIPTDIFLLNELSSVTSLYFDFQLLTNLAAIARRYGCPQEKTLLHFRTIQTILLTVLAFTTQFEELSEVSIILVIVQIVVMICLCVSLRNFKRAVEDLPDVGFCE